MAGGVDVSKRKPRRIGTTPANAYIRNRSLGILAVGVLIGVGIYFSPLTKNSERYFEQDWVKQIEQEDNDFRDLINSSLLPHRGPKGIQRQLDQAADFRASR